MGRIVMVVVSYESLIDVHVRDVLRGRVHVAGPLRLGREAQPQPYDSETRAAPIRSGNALAILFRPMCSCQY